MTEYAPGTTLAPGTYTRVAIHDDGRGFDAIKRNAVFEGFLSKPEEISAGPALASGLTRSCANGAEILRSSANPFAVRLS